MRDRATTSRPTAIVIGASASGLLAAAALAEHADVTVIERDTLPAGPEARRGIPQAHHAHLVWTGGVKAFDDLLPGLVQALVDEGARLVRIMGDMVSRAPNEVWFRRFDKVPHRNLVCSRPLLDHVLSTRVLKDPGITLRENTTVLGIEGTPEAVTGVRLQSADAQESLQADLVVDASGRGTRAPQWLHALGLPEVEVREVNAGVAYASRLYRAPEHAQTTSFPLVNVQANPANPPGQGGIIVPIEGNRWIVTLAGTRGGEPTADNDQFVKFALGLGDPVIGELVQHAEPLSDVRTSRATANVRRYYEKMRRWPAGFAALGDAIAGYNPVYGHGLTVAAQCAVAVRDVLRNHPITDAGTAKRLQNAAARPVGAAWDLAVGQDALYPGASDSPPTTAERALARYVDRCVETGAANPRALVALLDVMSLLKPPTRLFSPDMVRPMLVGPKKPLLSGPPLTPAERNTSPH
ncbi:FAD-dependent monooxygenase [Streptomyces sp. VN1]|uniref:NAD(P)/FAD-dependent oxidoreductase n=1 Tax=Streptomyces sp. VN1 TaxID=1821625 RepID=UPI001413DDA8|nr:FAD-dependent monooxygenase [Streptomyces sp. VN1]QIP74629.1 FAD-dependent oxidoreductase [Streptomyces sp. VN1]